jgi:hypothetical protein
VRHVLSCDALLPLNASHYFNTFSCFAILDKNQPANKSFSSLEVDFSHLVEVVVTRFMANVVLCWCCLEVGYWFVSLRIIFVNYLLPPPTSKLHYYALWLAWAALRKKEKIPALPCSRGQQLQSCINPTDIHVKRKAEALS